MKELSFAKSNIRKAKGLTVGLILLIMLAACFFNIVLIIYTDFNKLPEKTAEKLNSEDAYIQLTGDVSKVDEEYIKKFINEDVKEFEITKQRGDGISVSTPYAEGEVTPGIVFVKESDAFGYKIGKNEVVEKDDSIKENFVYLPYQYHTGGKYNVGDNYEIKLFDKTYNFKIKGFINNLYLGSYNLGNVEFVLSDEIYEEISEKVGESVIVKFDLKETVDQMKFINKLSEKITTDNKDIATLVSTLEDAIFGRTFVSLIFGALFLIISGVIIVIVLLMLSNNISNYIKENMKTLGAVKALGYTNQNIKVSFLMQFTIIGLIGCTLGLGLSYLLAPVVTGIIAIQAGFPYEVSFNIFSTILTVISTMFIIIGSLLFFLRKTNKISPITALRDGIQTHNFKKNRIKLEKTKLPINISLALKTTFYNMKQNIATYVIVFFLVYMAVIGLVLYQNFAVEPKLSLLSFEICDGAVVINDTTKNDEILNYIKSIPEVQNTRLVTNAFFNFEDVRITTYILDDSNNLKNQDVCYKGRLPKYENEVALSGKVCKSYNYEIGDEVELSLGDKKEKYILSGFIQTSNNSGREGVILDKGAQKILGENFVRGYYFETTVDTAKVIKQIENIYADSITTFNFQEIISGSISAFELIATALVVLILIINVLIILLVLYLLIKTLINNKKKDYGILKALGYTSKNIILQNGVSFMPTIILSVVTSSIISCFIVNPSICLIMNMFGIMKLTFDIPVNLVILMGIGFTLISFIIAIGLSRKIKKIEPYKLLTEE